jgi:acyl-CoA synthetase (NDP forming)
VSREGEWDDLRASGYLLDDGRVAVPEHVVKAVLTGFGVQVPRAAVTSSLTGVRAAARELEPPLVLKAWGPGLLHKSDVGAVRVGLDLGSIDGAAREMAEALGARGLHALGYVVEEQQDAGLEILVGAVRRPDFGPVVVVGAGGTMAEDLDQTVVRLWPVDETSAREMLDALPGTSVLGRARARRPVDRPALVALVLAIAGAGGLVDRLGEPFDEFECNPVIATATGAVAVDARLVLRESATAAADPPAPPAPWSMDRLFRPRSIAVLGASTTKFAFGNRFLRSYRRLGWEDGLYAVHPDASEVEGVPAYRRLADIPGDVDYVLVAVPAAACAGVLRDAAGKAAFAQVMTAGFREAGEAGAALEADLLRAARESGVRVVGPNCMGVYCPTGRQAFQLRDPTEPGTVAVVSQSGGLAGDIIKAGAERGVRFSKLASIGNAVDVTAGELVDYFIEDPETDVIGGYLEGSSDGGRLLAALHRARGRKPIVLLVGGLSGAGAVAAASHTGSLAGDAKVWDAISAGTGATVVRTLEDLVATLSYLQRYASARVAADPSVLVVGPGGGASILAADASDRHHVDLVPVHDAVQTRLRSIGYGAGTSVANPIEIPIGPGVERSAFDPVLDAVLGAQPYPDVVVHINVHSFYSQGDRGVDPLLEMLAHLADAPRSSRLAITLRNLECAPGPDVDTVRALTHRLRLPWFRSFDEAMVAIQAAKRFTNARARS